MYRLGIAVNSKKIQTGQTTDLEVLRLLVLEKIQRAVQQKMKGNDPAHDFEHVMRVYSNALLIAENENVNKKLVLSAALLHDIVVYPKSDRRSKTSSTKSSFEAKKIMKKYEFTVEEIKIVVDAINDHSFSKNKNPKTLVGKILQDADRLDAIGAIGIARVFATGGSEKRSLYNKVDPFCKKHLPNDKKWILDHFFKKLLILEKKCIQNMLLKRPKDVLGLSKNI